jgi:hypothetical protein
MDEETQKTEAGRAEDKPRQESLTPMLRRIYEIVFKGKSAAWTAIFTCVLCVFSYLLYEVSDAANRLSIATQAASLSAIGPALVKQANPDGKTLKGWSVIVTWINSGSTATKTATMQSNVYIGVTSPTKGLDFNQLPQDRIVTAVIAPKSGLSVNPGFISLQDIEDVTAGKKHAFLWGWAVYRDGFNSSPRLSEYCLNIEGSSFPKADHTDFTKDASIITNPCGVHFCFNEECEDYAGRTK